MDIKILENMLDSYRQNKSELELLVHDKEEYLEQLKYANQEHTEEEYDCIAAMSLQAPVISDVPKSATNKFSSVTENVMINYQDELIHNNEFDILSIKKKIENLEKQIKKLRENIFTIDTLMKSLDDKEFFIIDNFYFKGYTWAEISVMHFDRFKQSPLAVSVLCSKKKDILLRLIEIENKRRKMCS